MRPRAPCTCGLLPRLWLLILALFGHGLLGEGTRKVDARERYGRAERAGKKEGAPMYLHASPPPYNLVLRAFPSENGCGASGSSHFLRVKPWGRGCPPQTPATHTTLKSLGTLHSLGGANIRFQTE